MLVNVPRESVVRRTSHTGVTFSLASCRETGAGPGTTTSPPGKERQGKARQTAATPLGYTPFTPHGSFPTTHSYSPSLWPGGRGKGMGAINEHETGRDEVCWRFGRNVWKYEHYFTIRCVKVRCYQ